MRFVLLLLLVAVVGLGAGCASTPSSKLENDAQVAEIQLSPEELHQQAAEAAVRQWYVIIERKLPDIMRRSFQMSDYPEELKARIKVVWETSLSEERFIRSLAPSYAERYSTEQLEYLRQLVWISDGRYRHQLTDYEQIGLRRVLGKLDELGVSQEQRHQFIDLYEIHASKIVDQALREVVVEELKYEAEHGPLPLPGEPLRYPSETAPSPLRNI